MLLDNPLVRDRRVLEEARSLASEGHELRLVCLQSSDLPEREERDGFLVERIIPRDIFSYRQKDVFEDLAERLSEADFDVVHCHDQYMLHLGCLIKKKKKKAMLIYDSHELFYAWPMNLPRNTPALTRLKSRMVRKALVRREQRNSSHIDALVTVNDSLAHLLRKHFHFKGRVRVLRNIPRLASVDRPGNYLREHFNLSSSDRILVFIGAHAYPATLNLEQVMDEVSSIAKLYFILIAREDDMRKEVQEYAADNGYANVLFHDFIPAEKVTEVLTSADVGLIPTWNRKDLSYWYALDNKLFEYAMAEIPILATRQPEYRNIIEKHGLGLCVDPEEKGAFRKGLEELLDQKDIYTQRSKEAKKELNWERESRVLTELYKSLS